MLARALRMPGEERELRGDWLYERKLDGLRCLAARGEAGVELWSRNHLSFNRRFPTIVEALARLQLDSFLIDGEIVAFLDGRSSFELLQSGQPGSEPVYVVFDVLFLLGHDTTPLPLIERRALLLRALSTTPEPILVSQSLSGEPGELLRSACAEGWEGLVAKRASSVYRSGRSADWRKLKCSARQELVVGGWTDPAGSRRGFGALLTGYYDGGRLRYAGKVGTGFDERTLRSLHTTLERLASDRSPFADAPRMRGGHWVRPELVAEVEFTEWTRDGRLRHPRFLGLRPDKAPFDVARETPGPGSPTP